MTLKPVPTSWSIQGDFIYRHHNELRVQLYLPKEETFPIPLKYIDVTRSTHTDLDVLQEKRLDDNWNVDSGRHLSNSWRGFTKLTLLKENLPKGYMWSGREIDKDSNKLPDQIMYGLKFGRKLVKPLRIERNRTGQKERSKLDNARKMKGIYIIDPDDEEHKEILNNAKRKLEKPMAPAELCIRGVFQNMYSCIVESHESTRQHAESSQSQKTMKTTLQSKGFTSMSLYNLLHKFIPMPQATKIPDAKEAVDK